MKFFKMGRTIGLLCFVGLAAITASAQPWSSRKPYPLKPLSSDIQDIITKDGSGLKCGKYFAMADTVAKPTPGQYALVAFMFMNSGESAFMLMGWNKFTVFVDNTKSVPTASYTPRRSPEDKLPFHWTITISDKDLKEAQACLPNPTL